MLMQYVDININEKIAFNYEAAEGATMAFIILHGLAEHKGRYIDFMYQLKSMGFSSFAIDLRGHGESDGKRGDIDNFHSYLYDLSMCLNYIRENFHEKSYVLFGHSVGGQIAATYMSAGYFTEDIVALILTSPAIAFNCMTKIIKFVPCHLFGNIKIKKRHSESREMLEKSRADPLSCKYFTLRLLKFLFIDGRKQAIEGLYNVKTPTLIICGECDNLVKANRISKLLNKINNKNITLKIYRNVRHRIVQNEGCEIRIQYIVNWLNKINTREDTK